VTRRAWAGVVALLALVGLGTGVWWQLGSSGSNAEPAWATIPRASLLLVVQLPNGPLAAAIAAGGDRPGVAIVVPPSAILTVPGQGDSTVADAVALPGPPAAAAISNLLGVWIDHYAITDSEHLIARIDREGGLAVFGERVSGRGVLSALGAPGRLATWREVVRALVWTRHPWRPADFADTDDASAAEAVLNAAGNVGVAALPTSRIPGGALEIDDAKAAAPLRAFGRAAAEPVPVVVLDGSGLPDVGRAAAERLIPAGFRIVSSGNASTLDHDRTLVVANGADVQDLAERARRSLGVGRVSVSAVPSGLAAVTIVLGKDFQPE
jgi:hypothetical protein